MLLEHDTGGTGALARVEDLELLGELPGSGYEQGAALVRRGDGQMVQLGPILYALLEELDGRRDTHELAEAMTEKLGRECDEEHVEAIAQKLAEQGLLVGSEANAPERLNPLLALRWKVIVTDPSLTRRLTAPFTWLFRPWVLVPVLLGFLAVCWFVLVEKGVASAAAQAFDKPELILLVFALGVASAGFHELGHASACRYGGGTPGAMGAGIYLVWPAFYTDVTDAYRLPRRDRLRTDLGGLYFNTIVAVLTLGAWAFLRIDALLLLIGLQMLEMVKQLSPVIRADGYHILSDATGVPDLYAHIVPTLKRLLPGSHRQPSALTGRARVMVTLWVLAIVPILVSLSLSAILLLPRIAASTWTSGSNVLDAMATDAQQGDVVNVLAAVVRLLALTLPVLGSVLIAKRIIGGVGGRAVRWSSDRPARRAFVLVSGTALACLAVWAWWPTGQYQPIRASDKGTIRQLIAQPAAVHSAPTQGSAAAAKPEVAPGTHLAVALIPEGGATEADPAIFVITDPKSGDSTVITSSTAPPTTNPTDGGEAPPPSDSTPTTATAFTFQLPDKPNANDSQAVAVNRTDGGTTYTIAYSLVTVHDGDAVDERNGAYAFANCTACTTVAVSFQVVLVVGQSDVIMPINIAEALNGNCPSCVTTAIANQIVVSVGTEPSDELLAQINEQLQRLDELDRLGPDVTPEQIATQVGQVQQGIDDALTAAGLLPTAQEQDTVTPPPDGTDTTTTEPDPSATSTDPTTTEPDATTSTDPSTQPADPAPAGDATTTTPTA